MMDLIRRVLRLSKASVHVPTPPPPPPALPQEAHRERQEAQRRIPPKWRALTQLAQAYADGDQALHRIRR